MRFYLVFGRWPLEMELKFDEWRCLLLLYIIISLFCLSKCKTNVVTKLIFENPCHSTELPWAMPIKLDVVILLEYFFFFFFPWTIYIKEKQYHFSIWKNLDPLTIYFQLIIIFFVCLIHIVMRFFFQLFWLSTFYILINKIKK
jgi:hypothetical protein